MNLEKKNKNGDQDREIYKSKNKNKKDKRLNLKLLLKNLKKIFKDWRNILNKINKNLDFKCIKVKPHSLKQVVLEDN